MCCNQLKHVTLVPPVSNMFNIELDPPHICEETGSVTPSGSCTADMSAVMVDISIDNMEVLRACKLPENTPEQVEINGILDLLNCNSGITKFFYTVNNIARTVMNELYKLSKKADSAKPQSTMDALSMF